MKIRAPDLSLHLKRHLAHFYLVFGDEPLQHKEAIEAIRKEANIQGYTEREIYEINPHFEEGSFLANLSTQSLFSDKRLIECRLTEGKIGNKVTEFLTELAKTSNTPHTILLISASKIDKKLQNSNWFSKLEQKGCIVSAYPLSKREALAWIEKRLQLAGFQAPLPILHLLFERTEGNLLAAAQVIEKLPLHANSPTLTLDTILEATRRETRFTIYDLVDAALSGSILKTSQIFASLKEEGIDPLLVNWAIAREVRTILLLIDNKVGANQPSIWKHREPLIKAFIARFSALKLQQILIKAKNVDDIVKGRSLGNAWENLLVICLILTGTYGG